MSYDFLWIGHPHFGDHVATKSAPGHQSHARSHARIMRGLVFRPFPAADLFWKKGSQQTFPRNGTPEQCWNDQMHKVLLQMVHAALADVTGQGPIFRRRPRDALSLRPGGVYRTATGAVRGPTPYLYVAALVAKWEAFPQTIVLNDNRSLSYSF